MIVRDWFLVPSLSSLRFRWFGLCKPRFVHIADTFPVDRVWVGNQTRMEGFLLLNIPEFAYPAPRFIYSPWCVPFASTDADLSVDDGCGFFVVQAATEWWFNDHARSISRSLPFASGDSSLDRVSFVLLISLIPFLMTEFESGTELGFLLLNILESSYPAQRFINSFLCLICL